VTVMLAIRNAVYLARKHFSLFGAKGLLTRALIGLYGAKGEFRALIPHSSQKNTSAAGHDRCCGVFFR
jgi:hypothetical protein